MLNWLAENLSTLVVVVILVAIVVLVVRKLISDKRQGKSSCGCGCSTCAMSDSCHSDQKTK
ncbi:MAG: FeoB-associated Cys-rich membrane protein [Saccharofermentans sp.]|nr:FeoB-associated Cys-rich membrane protein [Saccharofermentans sp.]